MPNISGRYAVVGVAETKVGKRPDASTHSLHLECMKASGFWFQISGRCAATYS